MTDRVRVLAPEGGPMLTKQSMAEDTDVNAIVSRHIAHAVPFPTGPAEYGDFSNSLDYHGSLNAILEAQDTFNRLPAAVRDYCENDPGVFLDLVHDESRRPELVKLGLVPEAVPASAGGPGGAEGAPPAPPPADAGSAPGAAPVPK